MPQDTEFLFHVCTFLFFILHFTLQKKIALFKLKNKQTKPRFLAGGQVPEFYQKSG